MLTTTIRARLQASTSTIRTTDMRKLLVALTLFCAATPAHAQLTSGIVLATKNWQLAGASGTINMLPAAKNNWGGWTFSSLTVTTSSTNATAPDGTATMSFLKEGTGTSQHYMQFLTISRGTGGANAVPFRMSCDAEAATRTRVALVAFNGSGHASTVVYDLAGGQIGVAQAISGSGGTVTAVGSPTISPIGIDVKTGGVVYRLTMDMAIGAGTGNSLGANVELDSGSGTAANSTTYTGNSTSGLYIWQCSILPVAAWTLVANPLHDDFTTTATIDLSNTKTAGFKWYVSNWPNAPQTVWTNFSPTTSSQATVSGSTLTLSSDPSFFSYGIGSAVTDGSTGYIGKAFVPPYLYQVSANWDPATFINGQTSWPALWMMPTEVLAGGGLRGCEHDMMEASDGTGANSPSGNEHDWTWPGGGGNPSANTITGASKSGSPTLTVNHKYQRLVISQSASLGSFGVIESFFDGVFISSAEITFSSSTGATPAATPSNPTGVFSECDTQHFIAIIGTGPGNHSGTINFNIDSADVFTSN